MATETQDLKTVHSILDQRSAALFESLTTFIERNADQNSAIEKLTQWRREYLTLAMRAREHAFHCGMNANYQESGIHNHLADAMDARADLCQSAIEGLQRLSSACGVVRGVHAKWTRLSPVAVTAPRE